MQKLNIPCIKTGEFAKLCGTTKRTLIHYDEIGLFRPAYTDENGYRYYSESQFDVFFTIDCLRELGMPLKEIGAFLNTRTPQALKQLLLEQKEEILREEERIRKLRQVVETKLSLVSLPETLVTDGVRIETSPEEYLVISEPLDTNDHEKIIQTICSHIGYCRKYNLNAGHPYGAMLHVSELQKKHWDTYAYFFTKVIDRPDGHPCHIKPAGTYAVTYLKGDYYHAEEAYELLFQWIREHQMQTGPFSYKEAVIDELASFSAKEYLTKISVQIF